MITKYDEEYSIFLSENTKISSDLELWNKNLESIKD